MAEGRTSKAWEKHEDEKFLEIVQHEVLVNGKKLEEVYPIVEQALEGRTEGACRYRFNTTLRKQLPAELAAAINKNNPASRGNGQAVVAGTTRSKLITRLQQVDRDLVKVDKDIADTEKKLQDLKDKKVDLGKQMSQYTEMLVKAATGGEGETA